MKPGLQSMLLTASQMQCVDARAASQGMDTFELMRTAGRAVADTALDMLDEPSRVLVLAGPGNNGGDGAVAATMLAAQGHRVSVVRFVAGSRRPGTSTADPVGADSSDEVASTGAEPRANGIAAASLQNDARKAFAQWHGFTLEHSLLLTEPEDQVRSLLAEADIVIDALFGAGLSRPLTGMLAELVRLVNQSPATVLAVDVPSGLDGDMHETRGECIQADATVTFFRYKPAHFLFPGRALCGRKVLAQIGLDEAQLDERWPDCLLNEPAWFADSLPRPGLQGHKFDRGHVLVRGGPLESTGAARMSAQTALACGAGLVSLASSSEALPVNAAHLTAVMLQRCNDPADWRAVLQDERLNSLLIGPGNGVNEQTRLVVEASLTANRHCVLDADALSCWPGETDRQSLFSLIGQCSGTTVLTPHAGEFSRLFPDIDQGSRLHRALLAARKSSAVVVFKGADTVIATPDGRSAINANAPPWLATAGAGDVLAGVIASLLAQGMPAFEAACAAVWLHGQAADTLGYPLTAERLIQQVPVELGRMAGWCAERHDQHTGGYR